MNGREKFGTVFAGRIGVASLIVSVAVLLAASAIPGTAQQPVGLPPTPEEEAILQQYKAARAARRLPPNPSAAAQSSAPVGSAVGSAVGPGNLSGAGTLSQPSQPFGGVPVQPGSPQNAGFAGGQQVSDPVGLGTAGVTPQTGADYGGSPESASQATGNVGLPPLADVMASAQTGAGNAPQTAAAGDLIGFFGSDDSGTHTIALVNTRKMQIAVYHIDRSGVLRLISSRPIDADFSVTLNATDPLPSQIRLLQGRVK
ncbi:hypothetical protein LOC67_03935 [Stieleria sp. JC731]|uniref:hypothetical protein n=1 Tax=Pirellulaceae TaxID=2691357 RepID=UPI001E496EEC|nr:hypothetical protein [Stieleria sp. JC731]MCC9599701.1 hypothetical protein [Stieleria sp. JC731]